MIRPRRWRRCERSCAALLAGPAEVAARWSAACAEASDPGLDDADSARANSSNAGLRSRRLGPGLVTGYYEPELRGAERPSAEYPVPLYALPPDPALRQADRAAIEAGALAGQGLELAWVDDPVDAFFLQIQGSGRVRLPDGRVLRLGYAGGTTIPTTPSAAA